MSAKFTTNSGNTKVSFEYTAPTAKVQQVISDCAARYHVEVTDDKGVVTNPFSGLTNKQKLDIVDGYLKRVILDSARAYRVQKDKDTARDAAEADVIIEHDLG